MPYTKSAVAPILLLVLWAAGAHAKEALNVNGKPMASFSTGTWHYQLAAMPCPQIRPYNKSAIKITLRQTAGFAGRQLSAAKRCKKLYCGRCVFCGARSACLFAGSEGLPAKCGLQCCNFNSTLNFSVPTRLAKQEGLS